MSAESGPTADVMDVPPAAGNCVVLQGAYGDRGNLELLFPDPDDGLWVCWGNNDEEAVGEVQPGGWSKGLRFATGTTYRDVAFLQARRGPDFLEALASTGDRLDRWTWSPGPGFERTGVVPLPTAGGRLRDVQFAETHRGFVALARVDDSCLMWRLDGTAYPELAWGVPQRIALPDGIEQLAMTIGSNGLIRCIAVREGRLWSTDDLAGQDWAHLGGADVRAICAVAGSRRAGPTGPDFLVATDQRLITIAGTERVGFEHEIPGIDAVAACASFVEERALEVVVRTGSELRHITV